MLLFTDALIEAERDSEQYGVDRVMEEARRGPMNGKALSETHSRWSPPVHGRSGDR